MDKDLASEVGERLRSIRKNKGLSQEALGALADIHPKYLSEIERGEKSVTVEVLYKVTKALNVSLEDFFRHIGDETDSNDLNVLSSIMNLVYSLETDTRNKLLQTLNLWFI